MSEEEENLPKQNRLRAEAKRMRQRRIRTVFLILAGVVACSGFYGWWLFQPVTSRHRPVPVDIPRGEGVTGVGAALEQSGIVRSRLAFAAYARWQGESQKLLPGRYTLSGDLSLAQILHLLRQGPGHGLEGRLRVTIPEGFTLKQTAERLGKAGVTDAPAFLKLAEHPANITAWDMDFPRPQGTLEGYLFPDTYEFLPNTPPMQVLDTLLLNFSRRFTRPYHQEIEAHGRGLHEIVTMASLIEREARISEDRPRIAGVIDNRLKQGMKLQIDATILYSLGHHKNRVLEKDLDVNSPYNTYRHEGLPPGPIANPGIGSLQAALKPEVSNFLYYVARPNGSHIFTRTLAEHDAARKQVKQERQHLGGVEGSPGG